MGGVLDQFRLDQSVAVVTGAAGLLGQKHCEALLEAGARVALLDINEAQLKAATTRLDSSRAFPIRTDIRNENELQEAAQKTAEHFGATANILVNNAAIDPKVSSDGGVEPSRLETFDLDRWNLEISVGLTGAMLCSRVFGEKMAKTGKGVILNVSSDLGLIAPDQRLYGSSEQGPVKPVTYSVIKHGLIGLTRYLATYWARQGVRCNAIAPGGVFNDHPSDFVERLTDRIPMGRMARLDEYQASVVYLCSEASSYMNGSVVTIDGGRTAW